MGGACAECGVPCPQKADDGKYYCDPCWKAWELGTVVRQQQLMRQSLASPAAITAWASTGLRAGREIQAKSSARVRDGASDTKKALERQRFADEYHQEKARSQQPLASSLQDWSEGARPVSFQKVVEREPIIFWDDLEARESHWVGLCNEPLDASEKQSAVFWGICDLKYDPTQPEGSRVKVLELGDGRASRFSHASGLSKKIFDSAYKLDKSPMRRGVMVDNKRYTHDVFVNCGLDFLRPKQFAYPRRYEPGLAARITSDLKVPQNGAVVLKLVNRARGAGVVVSPVPELDRILQQLLRLPTGKELLHWFDEREEWALRDLVPQDVLEEQKIHYWSNECPCFLAEELCHSHPVAVHRKSSDAANLGDSAGEVASAEGQSPDYFDGTLRVVFALCRVEGRLRIDWLGGYWKLPPGKLSGNVFASCDTLEAVRSSIVSSFNSEEKRTARIANDELLDVYATLGPALIKVFEAGDVNLKLLVFTYEDDPDFRAFLLCRHSSVVRSYARDIANRALDHADRVKRSQTVRSLPQQVVDSYILRTKGVNSALRRDWARALSFLKDATTKMPTNATALYLHGIVLQEMDQLAEAVVYFRRSFALDPDFRSPLISLGTCWLQLGQFRKSIEASELCLYLQPDAPVAHFNYGQAIYQLLQSNGKFTEEETKNMKEKARNALEKAKKGIPSSWDVVEGEILQYFRDGRVNVPDTLPVKVWKIYAWRP